MAYYSGQKDSFDTDTGIWTDTTVAGTITLTAGKKVFVKTSDTTLWTDLGHIHTASRVFTKGDILFLALTLDDISTDGSNGTYIFAGPCASVVVSSALPLSSYIYPDTGVKTHGATSGVCTDLTASPAMSGAIEYLIKIVCDAGDGTLNMSISGGSFSGFVDFATGLVDATPSGGNYSLRVQNALYSIHSNNSWLYFGWCNAAGPTPDAPTDPGLTLDGEITILVEWTNVEAADFETGFKVERSLSSGSGFSVIATVAFGTTEYEDAGLDAETTYYYRLRSYFTFSGTDYYSGYTSEVSETTSGGGSDTDGEDALMVDIL